LDALGDTSTAEPVDNADAHALSNENRLCNAFAFMRHQTGKQAERMKKRYDAAVTPHRCQAGDFVLLKP